MCIGGGRGEPQTQSLWIALKRLSRRDLFVATWDEEGRKYTREQHHDDQDRDKSRHSTSP